jgi:hypothetical protein
MRTIPARHADREQLNTVARPAILRDQIATSAACGRVRYPLPLRRGFAHGGQRRRRAQNILREAYDSVADTVIAAMDAQPAGEPALAGIVLSAWASLLGYLVAEIFGSLTQLIASTDLLYQAHIRTVMLGMGYQPDVIAAIVA